MELPTYSRLRLKTKKGEPLVVSHWRHKNEMGLMDNGIEWAYIEEKPATIFREPIRLWLDVSDRDVMRELNRLVNARYLAIQIAEGNAYASAKNRLLEDYE